MARRVAFAVLVLLLSACQPAEYVQTPPKRFQGNATAVVRYVDTEQVFSVCGLGPRVVGCERNGLITLPNPCQWPGNERFAQIACHELAHRNGWPSSHPKA